MVAHYKLLVDNRVRLCLVELVKFFFVPSSRIDDWGSFKIPKHGQVLFQCRRGVIKVPLHGVSHLSNLHLEKALLAKAVIGQKQDFYWVVYSSSDSFKHFTSGGNSHSDSFTLLITSRKANDSKVYNKKLHKCRTKNYGSRSKKSETRKSCNRNRQGKKFK